VFEYVRVFVHDNDDVIVHVDPHVLVDVGGFSEKTNGLR
jgi:hypothetical protein